MYRDRMLMAVDVLEQIQREGKPFKMHVWYDDITRVYDCGTAACALGWLSRDPRFQALGLKPPYSRVHHSPYLKHTKHSYYLYGTDAGQHLLGITHDQSQWLFLESYYSFASDPPRDITPAMVIDRFNYLLKLSDIDVQYWYPARSHCLVGVIV